MRAALALGIVLTAANGVARPDVYEVAEEALSAREYDRAADLYIGALRTPRALPVTKALARARLGLALRKSGRLEAAERELRRAIRESERADEAATAAIARRYLGRIYLVTQRVPLALEVYRLAADHYDAHGPDRERLATRLAMAAAQREAGAAAAAIESYQEAVTLAAQVGDARLTSIALLGLSIAITPLGDFRWKSELLDRAEEACWIVDDAGCARNVRTYQSTASMLSGDYETAIALADSLLATEGSAATVRQQSMTLALAHLRLGRPARAVEAIDDALFRTSKAETGTLLDALLYARAEASVALGDADAAEADVQRARAAGGAGLRKFDGLPLLAAVARLRGHSDQAIALLEAHVVEMGRTRRSLQGLELSRFFHSQRVRDADDLLALYLATGRRADAVLHVARFKARAYAEEIARDRWVRRARDPGLPESLARRSAFLDAVGALPAETPDADADAALARLQRSLPPSVVVVDAYLLEHRLVVSTVDRDRAWVRTVDVDRIEVTRRARALLSSVVAGDDHYAEDARWLARHLLEPVDDLLRAHDGGVLAFVGHGPLNQLPVAMLPLGDGLVIDRFAVVRAPSLEALVQMQQRGHALSPGARVLVVSDPLEDLRYAATDQRMLARLFSNTRVLAGAEATEPAVVAAIADADIIHVASHAHQPGPDSSAWISLRGRGGEDGRLHAHEVARLALGAEVAGLFACESGVGIPNEGGEVLHSIERAFMEAGAATVVATLWKVDDAIASAVAARFYDELAGGTPRAMALARAQRGARARRTSTVRCRERGVRPCSRLAPGHPRGWAAFTITGRYL